MGKWFPWIYDQAMKPLEKIKLKRVRSELVNLATGRVLEIGSGTGLNFPYYVNASRVDAIEPNSIMRNRSLQVKSSTSIQLYDAVAEKLPFADHTFDTVVATLVFCTIPDPSKALQELERVSKPGAKILMLEHVRMPHKFLGKTQDILTPLWKRACDGCHLNRNTQELVEHSGLSIRRVNTYYRGLFVSMECVRN